MNNNEEKGWFAQNPYRTAFIALIVVIVGVLFGVFNTLGGQDDAPEASPPPTPPQTSEAVPQEGETEPEQPVGDKIPDGVLIVGRDIDPGVYESDGEDLCHWDRLSDPKADPYELGNAGVIESGTAFFRMGILKVDPTDAALYSESCGWTKVG